MAKRPHIPKKVRLQVWTEAAGRCQFRHCNTPLWYNELTLNDTNFGEMAHIIGASKKGPRGNDRSEELARDPKNIMIVCDRCHKEIDDGVLRELYPAKILIAMKEEHSSRVRVLLDQPSKKTRPLILNSQIGGQTSSFGDRSIKNAILPDYPAGLSEDWYRIEIGSFNRAKPEAWEIAKYKVAEEVDRVTRSLSSGKVSHLSVFALAPQPILMHLGRLLGDKISLQVFEPMRVDDQDLKWKWESEDGESTEFSTGRVKQGIGENVILLLALSDYLHEDKYKAMIKGNPHVYQCSIENPRQGFLKKRSEKAAFISTCRSLLNRIQKEIGKDCKIHVLPAMPASLAVEFGRLIQPTKDPDIYIYEECDGQNPTMITALKD